VVKEVESREGIIHCFYDWGVEIWGVKGVDFGGECELRYIVNGVAAIGEEHVRGFASFVVLGEHVG